VKGDRASERAMKTFSLHWGSGVVEEEAQIETPYHRPTIQLLKFTGARPRARTRSASVPTTTPAAFSACRLSSRAAMSCVFECAR
jgi:hypothetical protein